MTAEVKEQSGEIRGVNVRWASVIVAGHTVEQVLFFDVAEAEAVHGRPFDDELDENIQMGMFAVDRIAAGGTMHKVASARSYVLDGKCISPNPPMDGARIAEGGEEVTDATVRARIRVDWRLAGGLSALLGVLIAACDGCGERDGGIGHGKKHSRTGPGASWRGS